MSNVTCEDVVRDHLRYYGDRFSCHEESGRFWIVSPYTLPDGDLLEVTVRELRSGDVIVTDLGETLRHLADHGFDPKSTVKGEYLLEEILKQHHVELDRGMIVKRVPLTEVGVAMQEVLTASLAVAHLVFLSRGYRPATFVEEVSHFLADQQLEVRPPDIVIGHTGKKYRVDLIVRGKQQDALIQTLSPATPPGATSMVNATFRLWSDVANGRWHGTVLDDRQIRWRREDVFLLEGVSHVYAWTQRADSLGRDIRALVGAG